MGFKFEWDDKALKRLEKEATAKVRELTRERATKALADLRCPDHDQPIRYVIDEGTAGPHQQQLGRIEACCEKAAMIGKEALTRAKE
jgi:hypothetical protein